ncbi:hypothetical protein PQO01_14035 [Lentisphaera marina]|uniref:hypothetical protein n=1 Tax=Lentisphaera marina TaxID=1111041 RepID=UPI002365A955|nr:hypothetical protein [Lentisphaera marina]MDD7986067.1 hypothetical protein [Lentisphaera marina]
MSTLLNIETFYASSSIDLIPVNPAQWSPWLILIGLTLSIFILSSIACKKTGLHTSKATICLIPIIGPFIFFWVLAFSNWPIHDKLPSPEELESK